MWTNRIMLSPGISAWSLLCVVRVLCHHKRMQVKLPSFDSVGSIFSSKRVSYYRTKKTSFAGSYIHLEQLSVLCFWRNETHWRWCCNGTKAGTFQTTTAYSHILLIPYKNLRLSQTFLLLILKMGPKQQFFWEIRVEVLRKSSKPSNVLSERVCVFVPDQYADEKNWSFFWPDNDTSSFQPSISQPSSLRKPGNRSGPSLSKRALQNYVSIYILLIQNPITWFAKIRFESS